MEPPQSGAKVQQVYPTYARKVDSAAHGVSSNLMTFYPLMPQRPSDCSV